MAANNTLDIFGRIPQTVGQAYSSDSFQIAIAGRDHDFMLVQNLAWNYAQNITRIFDLESADYQAYVSSRPQGQLTIANVVTNLDSAIEFMQKYGDVCQADTDKNIVISIEGRAEDTGLCRIQGGSLSFSQPVLTAANTSIAVADYMVNNNMTFIFAGVKPGGATGGSSI